MDESLSMSLLERFDAMETEAGEPERRIGTVVMQRDGKGRLGVKIGGAPSGVYVDRIDWDVATVVNGSLQVCNIQGAFFTGPPLKKFKYGKTRLGEVRCI